MGNVKKAQVALFIDADNIAASKCDEIMLVCKKLGNLIIRRAYGDFTHSNGASWQDCLAANAISPLQNFSVSSGKNAADIALVIDAMDMLAQNRADVFCIASSDSDFTRLATRLGESGKTVIGIGSGKAPTGFQNSCDRFHILGKVGKSKIAALENTKTKKDTRPYFDALNVVLTAIDDLQAAGKNVHLSPLGKRINELHPDMKYATLGSKQLSGVLSKLEGLNIVQATRKDKTIESVRLRK